MGTKHITLLLLKPSNSIETKEVGGLPLHQSLSLFVLLCDL